jgi:vacuolar-type H+-ATPase subunit B/Vma2
MISTAMVMPLLLASRVGLWMARTGVKAEAADDVMPQSVPVRIDAASGLPHAHLDAEVARRARHAS